MGISAQTTQPSRNRSNRPLLVYFRMSGAIATKAVPAMMRPYFSPSMYVTSMTPASAIESINNGKNCVYGYRIAMLGSWPDAFMSWMTLYPMPTRMNRTTPRKMYRDVFTLLFLISRTLGTTRTMMTDNNNTRITSITRNIVIPLSTCIRSPILSVCPDIVNVILSVANLK